MRQSRPTKPSGMSPWVLPGIVISIAVAVAAVFVGYQIGKGSGHTSPTPVVVFSPTPASSPTPAPTPGASRTPKASVTPTASVTPSASVTPTVSATLGVTLTPESTLTPNQKRAMQANQIRAKGYEPRRWSYSDISGGQIWAWKSTCAGSAEHYCQNVFFFNGTTMLGTDTSKPSRDILRVTPEAGGAFHVTYANYQSGDADCCPSGKPVTVTYTWNGSGMTANGTPPSP
jgi:hypothetical protein